MKCENCGAMLAEGERTCAYCGTVPPPPAEPAPVYAAVPPAPTVIIHQYGAVPAAAPPPVYAAAASAKNRWLAFALALLFGYFGIHYFYVGRAGMGLLYLFTCGLFGIGWIVDMVRTASGTFPDRYGLPLR